MIQIVLINQLLIDKYSRDYQQAKETNMSKKNKAQHEDGFDVEVGGDYDGPMTSADAVEDAEKLEAFKQKKREAAKRFKERRAAEKVERVEKAKKLLEIMKDNGSYDQLDPDMQNFISSLANPVSGTGVMTESVFTKMFGGNPTVGATVTLREAFNNTLKGKAEIDKRVKVWKEKGIVVTYQQDNNNIFESTYTIEALA